MLDEAGSEEDMKTERFLINTNDIALKINNLSEQLIKNCSHVINEIREQELAIGSPVCIEGDQLVSRDPSERPGNMNDHQRKFLIELGPSQPKLRSFPCNETIPRNKQNRFNASWYDSFPHLEYSQKVDKAYCFVCSLFPSGPGREKSDPAWIDGIRSWHKMKSVGVNKRGKLLQHFSSESHKAAFGDFARFSIEACHVDVIMSAQLKDRLIQEKADEEKNKEIMAILFDAAKTLSKQSLAFRGSGKDENGSYITDCQSPFQTLSCLKDMA